MARMLHPPQERFDPITARWLTPGGPLTDPQRDSIDPGHAEPVSLVGPVPRELAEPDGSVNDAGRRSAAATRRRRLIMLAVLTFVALMLIGGFY